MPSTLSRIETGKAPTRSSYLTVLLDPYGVDDPGQRALLAKMACQGQLKDWWATCADLLSHGARRYMSLETNASCVCSYSALAVPSLLQTSGYATAACRAMRPNLTANEVDRLVTVHRLREESMRHGGCHFHVIVDERALRRPIASADVMKEQLEHLVAVTSTIDVTIQVADTDAARPVLSPSFTILSFADGMDSDIACWDGPGGQVSITSRDDDVRAACATFDVLAHTALSPMRSADLLESLASSG